MVNPSGSFFDEKYQKAWFKKNTLYMVCDSCKKKYFLCSDEALLEPLFRDRNN